MDRARGLPPYVLALFAIFCARGEGDADGARALVRQIAKSAGTGKLDFGGTRQLLFKHVRSPKSRKGCWASCLLIYCDGLHVRISS